METSPTPAHVGPAHRSSSPHTGPWASERELRRSTWGEGAPQRESWGSAHRETVHLCCAVGGLFHPLQDGPKSPPLPTPEQPGRRRDSLEEGGDGDAGSDPQSQESARPLKRGRGKNQGTGEEQEEFERSRGWGPVHQPPPTECLPACVCTHTLHVHTFRAHTIYTHLRCLLTPAATHPNTACAHAEVTLSMHKHPPHTHKHTQHTSTTHVLRVQPGTPVPGGGAQARLAS